jgi:hypothetical protein
VLYENTGRYEEALTDYRYDFSISVALMIICAWIHVIKLSEMCVSFQLKSLKCSQDCSGSSA